MSPEIKVILSFFFFIFSFFLSPYYLLYFAAMISDSVVNSCVLIQRSLQCRSDVGVHTLPSARSTSEEIDFIYRLHSRYIHLVVSKQ